MSEKNKKRCVLTDTGRAKLENALKSLPKDYRKRDGSYNLSKIAEAAKINRGTLSKILDSKGLKPVNKCEPVVHKTLKELFKFLSNPTDTDAIEIDYDGNCYQDLFLNDNDFKEANKQAKSSCRRQSQTAPNNAQRLKDALYKLNYHSQKNSFCQSVGNVNPLGAFLIYGKPDHGQLWLVNQLSYDVPYHSNAKIISLCFKRYRRNIQDFWANLAQEVGIDSPPPYPSSQEIVEAIYRHSETQTVMLCFKDVDLVAGKYLNQVWELWKLLIQEVRRSTEERRDCQNPLLLFLIDNRGDKEKLGITCVQQFSEDSPENPVEIDRLLPLEEGEIRRWVGTQTELFTNQESEPPDINNIITDIIDRNINPKKTFEAICTWCRLDWWEDIESTLRL